MPPENSPSRLEEELKKHWPSAIEGEFEHPDEGLVRYLTGEKKGKIAVRFTFEKQPAEESDKVFFLETDVQGWTLRHVSTFRTLDTELKLIRNQSFKIQDDLQQRYRDIIDLFMKSRDQWNAF